MVRSASQRMCDRPDDPSDRPADGGGQTESPSTSERFAELYAELHALAQRQLRRERPWHTLQATALVHEAYLQLTRGGERPWLERSQFLGTAARVIRHVLINHAVARGTAKRGGGAARVCLSETDDIAAPGPSVDLLALDEALHELERLDARQSRIVELRFFGGLSIDEIASMLEVSPRTVDGDWAMAKAWLLDRLQVEDS